MSLDYKMHYYDDGEPMGCDFCQAEVPLAECEGNCHTQTEDALLCELCCCTLAGNMHEYPEQFEHGSRDVMKAVCFIGNRILQAIAGIQGAGIKLTAEDRDAFMEMWEDRSPPPDPRGSLPDSLGPWD